MSEYKCNSHKIDFICQGCVKAWIARHDKMLDFIKELAKDFPDRDVYREILQEQAQDLLKEIGKL
jgi:hypothetical protein